MSPVALTDEQLEALARVLIDMVDAATLDRIEAESRDAGDAGEVAA